METHRVAADTGSEKPDFLFDDLSVRKLVEVWPLVDDSIQIGVESGSAVFGGPGRCGFLSMTCTYAPQQPGSWYRELIEGTGEDPLFEFRARNPDTSHQILRRIEGAHGKYGIDARLS